ncbi:hypothetical protein SRABI133_01048 [Peribacillus simplex]|uniref:Uncharacterized protein n=1 Tax=Peribacillus simplex TaxID=1478 RepID=A0A9W4KW54_9BACI|nr:hypothetical protein SRABI133_01048 [Peribacillus simplex]
MKKSKKYIVLFLWVVLFLYFFDMYMPKGIYYFVVGIPVLFLSSIFILKMLDHSKDLRS